MELKYLLSCSSIDLFDVKDFKRNLTDRNLIVFKENLMLQFSRLEEFRWGMISGWWIIDELQYENGPWRKEKKKKKRINFKLIQNCARVFPTKELFNFYCNNSTSFETVFSWKQLKVDYSKKIFKNKKIADTVLFVPWLPTYQWKKKSYRKLKFCWCKSS